MPIKVTVNGEARELDVDPDMPLLWAIRDHLKLTGTKFGCGMALCGACTVHIDGQATRSCVTPASRRLRARASRPSRGCRGEAGKAVQTAWISLDVPQCGYCQSGQIMSASALLATNAKPTDADIDCRDGRQHLPLRHLCPHPRRDSPGRRLAAGLAPATS